MKTILHIYATNSSAHGLPSLASTESRHHRLFWSLVCLVALASFISFGTILLERYYSYPKSIRIDINDEPVAFPAITICNLRHLDIYTLGDIAYDDNDSWRWKIGEDTGYMGRPNSPYPTFEELMIRYANYYYAFSVYLNVMARKYGEHVNDYFMNSQERMLLSRMSVAANLNETAALEGGTDIEQFIAICDFAGHKCTTANFTEFLDPTYFKCFTFDLSGYLDTNKVVFEGKDHGLSLIVFIPGIEIMNYTDRTLAKLAINQELLLSGEGLRVVIHKPNTIPFPLTDGLDVPRGISASMGIRLREHQRLGPPYGNCTTRTELDGIWTYTYTMATCKRMCLQKMIINICGCADTTLPFPSRTEYPDIQLCARFDDLPNYCLGSENINKFFDQCQPIFQKWLV